MKTFFDLKAPYEGLRVQRLRQSGRIVLYRVMIDPPPYWFVLIRGFDPNRDIAPGIIDPHKVPTWRFVSFADAEAKFEQLRAWPNRPGKNKRNRRGKNSERLRQYHFTSQEG
jgi:hypothetical protein